MNYWRDVLISIIGFVVVMFIIGYLTGCGGPCDGIYGVCIDNNHGYHVTNQTIDKAIDIVVDTTHRRDHGTFVRRSWLTDTLSGHSIHFINNQQRPMGMPMRADGQTRGDWLDDESESWVVFETGDEPISDTALCHELLHTFLFTINAPHHHHYRDYFIQSGKWSIEQDCQQKQHKEIP